MLLILQCLSERKTNRFHLDDDVDSFIISQMAFYNPTPTQDNKSESDMIWHRQNYVLFSSQISKSVPRNGTIGFILGVIWFGFALYSCPLQSCYVTLCYLHPGKLMAMRGIFPGGFVQPRISGKTNRDVCCTIVYPPYFSSRRRVCATNIYYEHFRFVLVATMQGLVLFRLFVKMRWNVCFFSTFYACL